MHRKTPEQKAWLKANASKNPHAVTIGLFEQEFGVRMTESSLASWMSENGIRMDPGLSKCRVWSDAERRYLSEIVPGRSHVEILGLMNGRFDGRFSLGQIKGAIKRYGLNTGRSGRFDKGHEPANKGRSWDEFMPPESQARSRSTCFAAGTVPPNHREVGSERTDAKDGYVWVKVADERDPEGYNDHRDLWVLKHRWVWEQHNGPVPDGSIVFFCDRDRYNFDPGNLMCVPQSVWSVVNKLGIPFYDRESAEAAVATARLVSKSYEVERKGRICTACGSRFDAGFGNQRRCRPCIDAKRPGKRIRSLKD